MDNRSTTKNNRRTVTVTLKDGTQASIQPFAEVRIRGNIAYSHFLTPLSKKQIEEKNTKRDEWAALNRDKTYYHEDVNKPYAEISLRSTTVVNDGQSLSDVERFAADRFYESQYAPGVKKANLKNYTATVSTGMIDDNGNEIPCEFEDELALGSDVICRGQIYINKGVPCIALTEVLSVGDPQYLDRSKYQKKTA